MTKAMSLCLALSERNVKIYNVLCECEAPFKWSSWSCLHPFPIGFWHISISLPKKRHQAICLYEQLHLIPYCLQAWASPGKQTSEGHSTLELGLRVLNALGFRAPISGISHLVQV